MSVLWRKVWGDLWGSKTRTALVILSIVVGVFAISMMVTAGVILPRELKRSFTAIYPSNVILNTEPVNPAVLAAVRALPEVKHLEGRTSLPTRVQVGAGERRNLTLFAAADYQAIQIDRLTPVQGAWPPQPDEIVIERASLAYLNTHIGELIQLETPTGQPQALRVVGLVHDVYQLAPEFEGGAIGYIAPETLAGLGGVTDVNELHITVSGDTTDARHVQQQVNRIRDALEQQGARVLYALLVVGDQHPLQTMVQGAVVVLGLLAVLSLLLSGLLIVNTMSALLTQQMRQIGILKALGGQRAQVMGLYARLVLIFGGVAWLIALPLGWLGGQAFAGFLAALLNFDIQNTAPPLEALFISLAVSLLLPLLAAAYPIDKGTRLTVREALHDYGIQDAASNNALERTFTAITWPPGIWRLARRNAFRRPQRLALTLLTLVAASAIALAVLNVRAALFKTLDQTKDFLTDDVSVTFSTAYPVADIRQTVAPLPNVARVECWSVLSGRHILPAGETGSDVTLWAPPAETTMLNPTFLAGRWLTATDTNAIVVNTYWWRDNPQLKVGDEVKIVLKGQMTVWQIVGIIAGVPNNMVPTPYAYVSHEHLSAQIDEVGLAHRVQVTLHQSDAAAQAAMADALEAALKGAGFRIDAIVEAVTMDAAFTSGYSVVISLFLVMAAVLAVVGALGLMGTMSLSVLERTREIGILYAVGATQGTVRTLILAEGVFLGILSWLGGLGLALPLSLALSHVVGRIFTGVALAFTFSIPSAGMWLGVVVGISAGASFLPAWRAGRMVVREMLSYE